VIVKKVGETTVKSPQLKEQREMPAQGEVFIAASGGPVTAGQPIQLTVDGMPHHNQAPRRIALALAAAIALAGAWFAARPAGHEPAQAAERKRLIARREKLFSELARLDHDHRSGRVDGRRSASRRERGVARAVYSASTADTGATLPTARVAAPSTCSGRPKGPAREKGCTSYPPRLAPCRAGA
jgi:hypothetical protein